MIFITGDTRSKKIVDVLKDNLIGRMVIERNFTPYNEYEPWGFDNGAFIYFKHGKTFDANDFQKRMEKAEKIGIPYMSIIPDIVAGGLKSLKLSEKWIDKMPYDWPKYLAVQEGMTVQDIEPFMQDIRVDGIFLGGTKHFKYTGKHWSDLAHKYGKKFHYGRAGTPSKIRHAMSVQSDSCDSAFPLWCMDRFVKFIDDYKNLEKKDYFFPVADPEEFIVDYCQINVWDLLEII